LSAEFEVTGFFYESCGYKFRKYLDIKRKDEAQTIPDLMVVMMNPGSSYPLDSVDNNSVPSEAEPDATQQQVMKIMNRASFNYARILNLSDLRTPNSNDLYKFVKSDDSKLVDHSIFSINRKAELNKLFIQNVPVIFGWGVNSALVPLAKLAIDSLCINNPLGMLKANTKYSYYHPLPRIYKKQLEWVQHVINQSTQMQQSCTSF
tara:strand:+ start:24189 stop:24803 length:615 start_codon:yes stop_codon:yes gene_type:complete